MGKPLPKTPAKTLQCISPVDGRIYVERPLHTTADVGAALKKAKNAQTMWHATPLAERQKYMLKFLDHMVANAKAIGEEITWQMGRPVSQTPGEILRGFQERVK